VGVICFKNKWRAEALQPGLEFDNFKPRLKSGILKCISWLNGSFFGGDDQGFPKEEVETCLMTPTSPPNPPNFFFLHIYSLWFEFLKIMFVCFLFLSNLRVSVTLAIPQDRSVWSSTWKLELRTHTNDAPGRENSSQSLFVYQGGPSQRSKVDHSSPPQYTYNQMATSLSCFIDSVTYSPFLVSDYDFFFCLFFFR
jgi:hypothetical protein